MPISLPPQKHVATVLLLDRAGSIYVARRAHTRTTDWLAGKYELPQGKIEPGEDARMAAVRETREELGVLIAPFGMVARMRLGPTGHILQFLVPAVIADGRQPTHHPDVHDAGGWLPPAAVVHGPAWCRDFEPTLRLAVTYARFVTATGILDQQFRGLACRGLSEQVHQGLVPPIPRCTWTAQPVTPAAQDAPRHRSSRLAAVPTRHAAHALR